jgi:Cu2+-exporting ATPase
MKTLTTPALMIGDNKNTAKAVADELNLSEFYAQCLPEDKLNKICNDLKL